MRSDFTAALRSTVLMIVLSATGCAGVSPAGQNEDAAQPVSQPGEAEHAESAGDPAGESANGDAGQQVEPDPVVEGIVKAGKGVVKGTLLIVFFLGALLMPVL